MGVSGKTSPIDCLVDAGADLACQDSEGRTPLMAAIMKGSTLDKKEERLIQFCEETRALNISDNDGNNVLHILASMKESRFTKDTIKVMLMLMQNTPTKMISSQGRLQSITKTMVCMRSWIAGCLGNRN